MPENLFDPRDHLDGNWPYVSKTGIGAFASGEEVGYAQEVLSNTSGHGFSQACRPVANPGPWNFDQATYNAVVNMQHWAGLPANGYIGSAEWGVLDWAHAGFPTT